MELTPGRVFIMPRDRQCICISPAGIKFVGVGRESTMDMKVDDLFSPGEARAMELHP